MNKSQIQQLKFELSLMTMLHAACLSVPFQVVKVSYYTYNI